MHAVETIRSELFSMRDEEYRIFQAKLMPDVPVKSVIGVRMPALRAYAKRLHGSALEQEFLKDLPHRYYEENNLHMALLEYVSDPTLAIKQLEAFLPFLDNWATCDSFCPKVLLQHPTLLLSHIRLWLRSPHAFTVRYGLVRLLAYLEDPLFCKEILSLAASVKREEYYVRMAQAWFFSIALIKREGETLPYLHENKLSPWVHNKAIQKARESLRCSREYKAYLASLRRSTPKESRNLTDENDNTLLS